MFTKGFILSEIDFYALLSDFGEMLWESFKELSDEERDELLKDEKGLEHWVKDQLVGTFESLLDDGNVDEAMILVKDKWHEVFSGEEFYYLSDRLGRVEDIIDELKEEFGRGVKENRLRRRLK
jgi:hypothetical protein